MEYNEKNVRVAKSIVDILAREKCTIEETAGILFYTQKVIRETSMVQISNESTSMLTFRD